MDELSTFNLRQIRRKATLLSAPLLGLLCIAGAWVISALPLFWWEQPLFISCGIIFLACTVWIWLKPSHSSYVTAVMMVNLVVLMEARILSVFIGDVLADPNRSLFLVLFAHIPLFYIYSFLVFPSTVAIRWSIAACALYGGTTLIFLIPIMMETPEREGLRHLLIWVTLSSPAFIAMLSNLPRLEEALTQLNEKHRAVSKSESVFAHQAHHDYLTGLFNRLSFDNTLNTLWIQALQQQKSLSVLMIDVDHFKGFNDEYGHQAGDRALQAVATTLAAHIRSPDLLARYGGEEFGIVLENTSPSEATQFAERLRQAVSETQIETPKGPYRYLTISIGVANTIPTKDSQASKLVAKADKALYRAKQNGRNRVESGAQKTTPFSPQIISNS